MVIICIVCKLNTRLEIQLLMYLHAIKYISGFFLHLLRFSLDSGACPGGGTDGSTGRHNERSHS